MEDSTYVENSYSYAPPEKLQDSVDSSSDDEASQEFQDADNDAQVAVTDQLLIKSSRSRSLYRLF